MSAHDGFIGGDVRDLPELNDALRHLEDLPCLLVFWVGLEERLNGRLDFVDGLRVFRSISTSAQCVGV